MIAPSALRALAQQATPGPWTTAEPGVGGPRLYVQQDRPMLTGTPVCGTMRSGMNKHAAEDAAFIAACDPQTILALLDAVEAATDLITNAADSSRDVKLEARRRLIAALAPFTETQT